MKFTVNKQKLLKSLLKQEDTTGSNTITVDDKGKKEFNIENENGNAIKIEGTYYLSNLLQEAALLKEDTGTILLEHIHERPTDRISRMIKDHYWDMLTRSLDGQGILNALEDEKMKGDVLRLYVPESDKEALDFYQQKTIHFDNVKVETISKSISNEAIKALDAKPGILALAHSKEKKQSLPFVVPGGRFNEMYGWDSYFIGIGLILNDKFELASAMIDNLEYQINHYGKILNANRSYYLTRSQPPFFTSFVVEFYEKYSNRLPQNWLEQKLKTALNEYFGVWMTDGIRLTSNGLSRYFGEGIGAPSETEPEHFDVIFETYAKKYGLPLETFKKQYGNTTIKDEDLDLYFIHDRSMRESGHDTTYRLDNCSAHLNTVDLNSLLYKFEKDIAYVIETYFEGHFQYAGVGYSASEWEIKAEARKEKMNALMWNEAEGSFYDYNFVTQKQQQFYSVSNLYPLWAGLCSPKQAQKMIGKQLPFMLSKGGLASTSVLETEKSNELARQWDFPYGWAPHQMLIWKGLNNFGFTKQSQELIYRWLWLIVKTAVNYNGLIAEKFDVKQCTHKVNVEYGNVGTNFKYVPEGGFGWTNASYVLGIQLLDKKYLEDLNNLVDPDEVF